MAHMYSHVYIHTHTKRKNPKLIIFCFHDRCFTSPSKQRYGRIQAVKNSDGQTPALLNYYEATLSSQFLIVETETELTQALKVFGVMPGKWCALQRSDLKAYLQSAGITGL